MPDLFDLPQSPQPAEPHVFTVTEITRSVRACLEESIGVVWIEGEVSNYRKQPSGHQYFTLKDEGSQLSCVWFAARGAGAWRKQVTLSDGMHVRVRGALTVYEARGQYQLNVQLVEAGGAGLLQAKFEALKRKLDAEGLFDPERKRELPRFPTAIGIVTSSTGAALRDMLNILGRRAPWVRVVVSPVRVQGEGAAREIAAAIAELNRLTEFGLPPVDVIVAGRGGGSAEDLWEFNEEIVARAIAASEIPVVSAVGHEIDFTIADFVADLRAPTPSAAAELIVPDTAELLRHIAQLGAQVRRCALIGIAQRKTHLESLKRSALFREPANRLADATQRLDAIADALRRTIRSALDAKRHDAAALISELRHHRPDQRLALYRQRFEKAAAMLRLLSPTATLARGYTITTDDAGKPIRSSRQVTPGSAMNTRFVDGTVQSVVSPDKATQTPK